MSATNPSPEVKRVPNEPDRAVRNLFFRHSTIRLEPGPAGTVARIDHDRRDGTEYAGPLPEATVEALRSVANRGDAR
jgi:hypothetical protein